MFLLSVLTTDNRERMVEVLDWVAQHYPELELRIARNQTMFTHHGRYIIGSQPHPSTWRWLASEA